MISHNLKLAKILEQNVIQSMSDSCVKSDKINGINEVDYDWANFLLVNSSESDKYEL